MAFELDARGPGLESPSLLINFFLQNELHIRTPDPSCFPNDPHQYFKENDQRINYKSAKCLCNVCFMGAAY